MTRSLLRLELADQLGSGLGPLTLLGQEALPLRLLDPRRQRHADRDGAEQRDHDRDPGAAAHLPPQPARQLNQAGQWLIAVRLRAVGLAALSAGHPLPQYRDDARQAQAPMI
jgi:hypothetical protein